MELGGLTGFFSGIAFLWVLILGFKYFGVKLSVHRKVERGIKKRDTVKLIQGDEIPTSPHEVRREVLPAFIPEQLEVTATSERQVFFGGKWVSEDTLTRGVLFLGRPGMGKTAMMEAMLGGCLDRIGRFNPVTGKLYNERGVILDPKNRNVALLDSLGVPYRVLDPFITHPNVVEWDIASEIVESPYFAGEISAMLLPIPRDTTEPFWLQCCQALMKHTMLALARRHGRNWSFRDLIHCLRRIHVLEELLSDTEDSRLALKKYTKNRTAEDIETNIEADLDRYTVLADAWDGSKRKFSTSSWLNSHYMLVLPFDKQYSKVFRDLYGVILTLLYRKAVSRTNPDCDIPEFLEEGETPSRFYFILDELQNCAKIEGFPEFLNEGRSKGVCTMLCLQDIYQLNRDYGDDGRKEILTGLGSRAIFRLNDDSASWFESAMGDLYYEVLSRSPHVSYSTDKSGKTSVNQSAQQAVHTRNMKAVSKSSLIRMAKADFKSDVSGKQIGKGITGIYDHEGDIWQCRIPASELLKILPKRNLKVLREWQSLARVWNGNSTMQVYQKPFTEKDYSRVLQREFSLEEAEKKMKGKKKGIILPLDKNKKVENN